MLLDQLVNFLLPVNRDLKNVIGEVARLFVHFSAL